MLAPLTIALALHHHPIAAAVQAVLDQAEAARLAQQADVQHLQVFAVRTWHINSWRRADLGFWMRVRNVLAAPAYWA